MPDPGPERGRDVAPDRESTTPYQGVPRPTRRTLLDGIALLGGLGITATVADKVRLGPVDAPTPPTDAWPFRRYDPAGTASNTDATPPTDPGVDWVDESLAASRTVPVRIVVGPESVYASAVGTVAIERPTGTRRWRTDAPGGRLAFRDGRLFVGSSEVPRLTAVATDGTEQWAAEPADPVTSLLVADGTLFVGGDRRVGAYDAASGSHRWTDGEDWADRVLVADGTLVTVGDGIARYRRRSILDVPLRSPPPFAWTVADDYVHSAAATDTGMIAGFLRDHRADQQPALIAYDHGGDVRWRALGGDGTGPVAVGPLATAGHHAFVGIERRTSDDDERHAVASYQIADGSRRWRCSIDRPVTDLVLVDDAVLIATRPADGAPDTGGGVRALDATDGSERWRVPVDPGCRSLAPTDGTVFAVSTDGRVLAIR